MSIENRWGSDDMKSVCWILTTLLLLSAVYGLPPLPQSGLSYVIHFEMNGEKLTCPSWDIGDGDSPDYRIQPSDGHILSALDEDGNKIYSLRFLLLSAPRFAAPREWFDENGTQIYFENLTGAPPVEQMQTQIIVPYHPDAVKIRISAPNETMMLEIDVSKYAHMDLQTIDRNREEEQIAKSQISLDGTVDATVDTESAWKKYPGSVLVGAAIFFIGICAIALLGWKLVKKNGPETHRGKQMQKKALKRR